jgi:hypothetical protein
MRDARSQLTAKNSGYDGTTNLQSILGTKTAVVKLLRNYSALDQYAGLCHQVVLRRGPIKRCFASELWESHVHFPLIVVDQRAACNDFSASDAFSIRFNASYGIISS